MEDRQSQSFFELIPLGREGYVYLIHAEGTTRYKIGRSVNPVVRQQELQKQSPYPLKIVKSFWTLDAITDELWLHKKFDKFRVFGEWFSFNNDWDKELFAEYMVSKQGTSISYTTAKIAQSTSIFFCSVLSITDFDYSHKMYLRIGFLCSLLKSRRNFVLAEDFSRETLPLLIDRTFSEKDFFCPAKIGRPSEAVEGFIKGSFKTFAYYKIVSNED